MNEPLAAFVLVRKPCYTFLIKEHDKETPMPGINFSVPEARGHLYVNLREKAKQSGCSLSHVVCEALEAFFSSGSKPQRKQTLGGKILDVIESMCGATPREIALAVDKDEATIRAMLAYLKRNGLVEKPEAGKMRKWYVQ